MSWINRIWDRLARTELASPLPQRNVSDDPLLGGLFNTASIVPKPAARAEQFADIKAPDEQTVPYARLVRGNNAHVTRNYGKGDVDESTVRERRLAEAVGGVLSPEELSPLRKFDVYTTEGNSELVPKNPDEIDRRAALAEWTVARLGAQDRAHGRRMAAKE